MVVARLSTAGQWTAGVQAAGSGSDFPTSLSVANGATIVTGTSSSPTLQLGSFSLAQNNSQQLVFTAQLGGFVTSRRAIQTVPAFTLAPTPATTATRLTWPSPSATPRPVQLLDALGCAVRQQVLPAHTTQATLDLTGLAPGLYLVRCGSAVGRLVVE
ncbi:hypothetical protein Q5H93_10800 [Hymenobacter sp. ASUV-10]|uniref:T9SS type A sorting domain-containing protein n=1 Tax=Hymenobacter aranciens TaxID=3063996 RepID=A0ABT9BAC4_9BACT|nr:hypothetical protein [Hymenobacter sp. ASUV-10]MDO7875221.1 hypothetical protein [Hymenobacter sp. ASUV-10]